jgi:hypothetical protein
MSIRDEIKDRVRRGMLTPLIPRAAGATVRRALFLTEEVRGILYSDEGGPEWEQRVGELRADLEAFVEGLLITPKYLFLLSPTAKGIWEIRSVRTAPSIRVLCLFAERDILVATNAALRGDLGLWQSHDWREAKRRAQAQWRGLFHQYQPVISTSVDDVVTGAVGGQYHKAFLRGRS